MRYIMCMCVKCVCECAGMCRRVSVCGHTHTYAPGAWPWWREWSQPSAGAWLLSDDCIPIPAASSSAEHKPEIDPQLPCSRRHTSTSASISHPGL